MNFPRIDTCIVGDDTTCEMEKHEVCKTYLGVSSCFCKPGYGRKNHRQKCKSEFFGLYTVHGALELPTSERKPCMNRD